jgi:glycine/D-amino acid oxidase-like deaminating enzyme
VNRSLWLETAPEAPVFARLDADLTADVCVIGGGIAGITTALLLHEAGARVVVLEASRIGHGVTGHTTAKVSSQHGLIYAQLRAKHGADAARGYGAANEAGLAWIAARVERDGIECDFRRRSS